MKQAQRITSFCSYFKYVLPHPYTYSHGYHRCTESLEVLTVLTNKKNASIHHDRRLISAYFFHFCLPYTHRKKIVPKLFGRVHLWILDMCQRTLWGICTKFFKMIAPSRFEKCPFQCFGHKIKSKILFLKKMKQPWFLIEFEMSKTLCFIL